MGVGVFGERELRSPFSVFSNHVATISKNFLNCLHLRFSAKLPSVIYLFDYFW